MLEVFGKQYQLDSLIFSIVFILSIGIISLNIFYTFKFGADIINTYLGIGVALIVYSSYNLFFK